MARHRIWKAAILQAQRLPRHRCNLAAAGEVAPGERGRGERLAAAREVAVFVRLNLSPPGSVAAAAARDVGSESRKTTTHVAAAARTTSAGRPSVEAMAMAGCEYEHWHQSVDEEEETTPPEHLLAVDAFLEEAVPADMVVAWRLEEEVRLRRGGRPRSSDDGVKEMLRLWAKAMAKKALDNFVNAKAIATRVNC
ncbi:hypothetical protein E2562_033368 [Oryza meyeriana var. granulata]|uniref:Uncharacterized protein n=1 Tax=Oryza meyeriana var. granulata TaxID=110450 RepID=A0A6G1C1V3_9ORYZ|nr:hypothetical protein E2562_033368 [Oryza meyeriana var. granulata]